MNSAWRGNNVNILNANLKEIAMNVTTLKSSAMQFASRIIPEWSQEWNERIDELQYDAKALKDAVIVRFSTDPQVLQEMDENYWNASEEAHTSLAPEDCERIHRRTRWVQTAVRNRLDALAKRWNLPEVRLGCGPGNNAMFCTPDTVESVNPPEVNPCWKFIDHVELEEQRVRTRKEATSEIVAAAKKLGKSLGAVAGLFIGFVGVVCAIYLGGYLGSIAALFALGAIFELVV